MIDATVTEAIPQNAETPAVINISGIISDLDNGIDRDGIASKYNLTKAEVKFMFQHPALKGKRAKKKPTLRFQLVDDVTPTNVVMETPQAMHVTTPVEETPQPTSYATDNVAENANDGDMYTSGTDLY